MNDQALIDQAARRLIQAAPAGSRVILFGSHARRDAAGDSDVDFLVIEPTVENPAAEASRLREVVGALGVAVDVLVTSREHYEYWRQTPNHLYYEVDKEGRACAAVG